MKKIIILACLLLMGSFLFWESGQSLAGPGRKGKYDKEAVIKRWEQRVTPEEIKEAAARIRTARLKAIQAAIAAQKKGGKK